jgi:hypothetical protein
VSDRPRPTFQLHPAKGDAFPKTRVPLTAAMQVLRTDCSAPEPASASRSRRSHFLAKEGVLVVEPCKRS